MDPNVSGIGRSGEVNVPAGTPIKGEGAAKTLIQAKVHAVSTSVFRQIFMKIWNVLATIPRAIQLSVERGQLEKEGKALEKEIKAEIADNLKYEKLNNFLTKVDAFSAKAEELDSKYNRMKAEHSTVFKRIRGELKGVQDKLSEAGKPATAGKLTTPKRSPKPEVGSKPVSPHVTVDTVGGNALKPKTPVGSPVHVATPKKAVDQLRHQKGLPNITDIEARRELFGELVVHTKKYDEAKKGVKDIREKVGKNLPRILDRLGGLGITKALEGTSFGGDKYETSLKVLLKNDEKTDLQEYRDAFDHVGSVLTKGIDTLRQTTSLRVAGQPTVELEDRQGILDQLRPISRELHTLQTECHEKLDAFTRIETTDEKQEALYGERYAKAGDLARSKTRAGAAERTLDELEDNQNRLDSLRSQIVELAAQKEPKDAGAKTERESEIAKLEKEFKWLAEVTEDIEAQIDKSRNLKESKIARRTERFEEIFPSTARGKSAVVDDAIANPRGKPRWADDMRSLSTGEQQAIKENMGEAKKARIAEVKKEAHAFIVKEFAPFIERAKEQHGLQKALGNRMGSWSLDNKILDFDLKRLQKEGIDDDTFASSLGVVERFVLDGLIRAGALVVRANNKGQITGVATNIYDLKGLSKGDLNVVRRLLTYRNQFEVLRGKAPTVAKHEESAPAAKPASPVKAETPHKEATSAPSPKGSPANAAGSVHASPGKAATPQKEASAAPSPKGLPAKPAGSVHASPVKAGSPAKVESHETEEVEDKLGAAKEFVRGKFVPFVERAMDEHKLKQSLGKRLGSWSIDNIRLGNHLRSLQAELTPDDYFIKVMNEVYDTVLKGLSQVGLVTVENKGQADETITPSDKFAQGDMDLLREMKEYIESI